MRGVMAIPLALILLGPRTITLPAAGAWHQPPRHGSHASRWLYVSSAVPRLEALAWGGAGQLREDLFWARRFCAIGFRCGFQQTVDLDMLQAAFLIQILA